MKLIFREIHAAYGKSPFLPALLFCLTLVLMSGCAQRKITAGSPSTAKISTGSMVANTAAAQIGKPYRSGGASPQRGFDCSGLVFWAYAQHDIKVPRATTEQAKAGTSIPRSKLLPGDIVVFRESSGPNKLHTGIYAGGNNFIHSPNSRSAVRIDSLETPHWRKAFVSGRRILK